MGLEFRESFIACGNLCSELVSFRFGLDVITDKSWKIIVCGLNILDSAKLFKFLIHGGHHIVY